MKCEKQEHKNERQSHRNGNKKPLLCLFQVLEGAPVAKEIARLKLYLRKYFLVHLLHDALHIPAAHVESNGNPPLGIVTLDLVGSHLQVNFCDLLQANLRAPLFAYIKTLYVVETFAFAFV